MSNVTSSSQLLASSAIPRAASYPDHSVDRNLTGNADRHGAALLAASVRDVLLRIDSVCAITGLSVPTIYRLMSKETFPRPLKITATARAWKLSEITGWVESRERWGTP
jgi:prophage regulatory protein